MANILEVPVDKVGDKLYIACGCIVEKNLRKSKIIKKLGIVLINCGKKGDNFYLKYGLKSSLYRNMHHLSPYTQD